MEMSKLAPAFAKLAEAAQEISEIFAAAGGVTLGKRAPAPCCWMRTANQSRRKRRSALPARPPSSTSS